MSQPESIINEKVWTFLTWLTIGLINVQPQSKRPRSTGQNFTHNFAHAIWNISYVITSISVWGLARTGSHTGSIVCMFSNTAEIKEERIIKTDVKKAEVFVCLYVKCLWPKKKTIWCTCKMSHWDTSTLSTLHFTCSNLATTLILTHFRANSYHCSVLLQNPFFPTDSVCCASFVCIVYKPSEAERYQQSQVKTVPQHAVHVHTVGKCRAIPHNYRSRYLTISIKITQTKSSLIYKP